MSTVAVELLIYSHFLNLSTSNLCLFKLCISDLMHTRDQFLIQETNVSTVPVELLIYSHLLNLSTSNLDMFKLCISDLMYTRDQNLVQETNMLTLPVSAQIRPIANFHPTIWGDQFITYTPEDKVARACKEDHVEDLKREVRMKLMAASRPWHLLNLIDAVQRLGGAYHFEGEIEEALQHVYDTFHDHDHADLHHVALRFRLLRQQGYNISCGIFNRFKDENGKFKKDLIKNVRGLLGLYEAAYLRVQGEEILEEALAFTTTHLTSIAERLEDPLASEVAHALELPLRKRVERPDSRWYISIYPHETLHDTTLLELAKLDFNLVQSLHKQELCDLYRWWKELDFASKLPFARDRLVEGYFWITGMYFEPHYACARRILTKIFAIASIVDDIYDAYGTLEELELFTQAVERWDISNMDHLPDYLKPCYTALLDVYKEIEEEMEKQGHQYRVPYAIKAMKNQVKAYFEEANWFLEQRMPTMEEYIDVGLRSSGHQLLITSSFIGMGEIVSVEAFDWALSDAKIVKASNLLARLINDIKSYKFEEKRGHLASAVGCYMKQHGVSEEQVLNELYGQIGNAWMDINQECLNPTAMPLPILNRVVNISRVLDLIYMEGDGYTNVGKFMKDSIRSVLIDPVP